jgi:hypothetical protein
MRTVFGAVEALLATYNEVGKYNQKL